MSLIFKHTVTLLVDLEMLLLSLHALHDNDILIILKSLSILFGIKFLSLRKQVTFGNATTGFSAKWCLRNEHRNFILITRHYPDLGSASDWLNQISQAARQIRRTNQIWVVISLPADVLWGSFVTHSFLPHGRLLNTADIYVHQSQAVYWFL